MGTKTLTIMEDVYELLAKHKRGDESFSEELRRMLAPRQKPKLMDFFGLFADDKGAMQRDLKAIRKTQQMLLKKRLRMLYEST